MNIQRSVGKHRPQLAGRWSFVPIILCALAGMPALASEPGNHWTVAPYLWAPHLHGRVGLGPVEVPLDVSSGELAGGVSSGAMGLLRWSDDRQFVYLEGISMRFTDKEFAPFFDQSVEAELAFAELGYGRHYSVNVDFPVRGAMVLSPYVGLRRVEMDVGVDSQFLGLRAEEQWLDPALGIIVQGPLYGRLDYAIKLDGAGFDIDRNHYWSGTAGLMLAATDSLGVVATWRVTSFSANPGGGNDLKLRLRGSGPEIGITYSF